MMMKWMQPCLLDHWSMFGHRASIWAHLDQYTPFHIDWLLQETPQPSPGPAGPQKVTNKWCSFRKKYILKILLVNINVNKHVLLMHVYANLKHHMNRWSKLYTFTVRKTEHFVVIKHSVHVLNPQGIDWTITYHPFMILTCVTDRVTNTQCHQSINPL